MNLDHAKITAPNRIGHIESNRANLVERYSLIPYYYSLAAKAAREGTPLMMPMAMAFPEDLRLRARGDERMIGDLLVRAAADSAASYVDVTLPRGLWYDIRDESALYANGYDDLRGVPLYRNGLYMLPVYAQAGGIITRGVEAKMEIDVYVNPESTKSEFVLHEDDGITRDGDARLTTVGQRTSDNTTTIDIGSAAGTFSGALSTRSWTVRAHAPSSFSVWRVMVGGSDVSLCGTVEVNGSPCYKIERRAGGAFVAINVPDEDVRQSKHIEIKWQPGADLRSSIHFVCNDNAGAERHASMFVVGNIKELGSWNPEHAVPMETNNFLRGAWTKMIYGLPSGGSLEWKCLRRMPQAGTQGVEWQPGPNNHLDLPGESGFAGLAHGAFFVDQKIGRTELYRMQRP